MAIGDKIQSTSINDLIDTLEAVRQRHVNFVNQSTAGLNALGAQTFNYEVESGSKVTTDPITQIKNYLAILSQSKFMGGVDYGAGINIPARGEKVFYTPDFTLIESAVGNADGVQCVNTGYNSGFRSGYRAGYDSGFNNSYNAGYDSGYNGSYNSSFRSGYDSSYNSSYRSGYDSSYRSGYRSYSSCGSFRASSSYGSSNAFYSTCCRAGGYSGS